jgi:hypothetical protein
MKTMKTMLELLYGLVRKTICKWNGLSRVGVLTGHFLCVLATSAIAQTALPFSDNFQSKTLNPAWQVEPGQGTYAVGGGHLRYYNDGPLASTIGWYSSALTFGLPFKGTNWKIELKATYSLDWCTAGTYTGPPAPNQTCSSGAQGPLFAVSFHPGVTTSAAGGPNYAGSDFALIERVIDAWYGSNMLSASYGTVSNSSLLNPADSTIHRNIADGTYWFQIIRNGGVLTINYSHNGVDYATALSAPLADPSSPYNELLLGGATYLTAGSFTDFGPVSVTSLDSPVATSGVPVVEGIGATWLQVLGPFYGDTNGNSYTTYEYATASGGPWTMACGNGISGDSGWRRCSIYSLNPDTPYFVRVTSFDPDGVTGTNPQVIGPISTLAISNDFMTIGQATAKVEDTNILVSLPVADDANTNGTGSVSVSASPNGPWAPRCSSISNLGPRHCRVHGLTKGADYYLQVNITDPDGVHGTTPQVIGPIHYTGLTDLALGKPVTADPGWGCCSNPNELTDGVIEASDWAHGFAWTGGTGYWGGECRGSNRLPSTYRLTSPWLASIGGFKTSRAFLPLGLYPSAVTVLALPKYLQIPE